MIKKVSSLFLGPYPKETLAVWAFSIFKVPMILSIRPRIVKLDDKELIIRVPLRRATKNHLNSMYFGALCIGADVAGGMMALFLINESKKKISLVFKDMQAEFLKRVEGDAYFICSAGEKIRALIDRAANSTERVEEKIPMVVKVPDKLGDEIAAKFVLTLSLKQKASHN